VHVCDGMPEKNSVRPVRLPQDLPALEQFVDENDIGLVVIDPILAFLDGGIDSHKDQSIRDVLSVLKYVAEKTGAAFLLLRHLNKRQGDAALYRGGGSIAFTAAARSALVVGEIPNEKHTYGLAVAKCNLAAPEPTLTYTVETLLGPPRIC